MHRNSRSLRALAISPKPSSTPASPPSPTFSDATHASAMNFGAGGPEKIITRTNLKASLQAYDELMNTSANYRAALINMAQVTAAFADAMDRCAGMKGPSYEAGTRLQAASGLHHLIGNHWHVLSETLDKKFEKPLRQHLDTYKTIVNERSASYEKALHAKSQIIHETEMNNMNKKQRNLQSFREALAVLQRQVDELDELKAQHYQEIMEHEEEVWNVVQGKVCVAVRSTMDVFDRFTAKTSDPVLEPMLQSVPDPFDSYGPPQAEDQIFTILPPLAVIANAPSPSPSPMTTTPPQSVDISPAVMNHSWMAAHTNGGGGGSGGGGGFMAESTSEWADVPSPSSTPPRASSPSSTVKRRPSHPPSNYSARKAESKLRSVLSVIDESLARQSPSSPTSDHAETDRQVLEPHSEVNGGGGLVTNWGSFGYGESPYGVDSGEVTPRHSTLFASSALDPDVAGRHSPHSDETA
ncbi:hypothetical protein SERLA73DRAFT_166250 [Serpula lacrymans var. lacrymans S7.3]|uniref:IMD domain-containing protein n=2 Tax=Serpula lacrymans var. lacrymans TaxID=341189 RepID=F8PNK4_SERL3|nr:uncharacterized protein SERLADRAFT_446593 [Serpula lacrymans var. lacrymans S7.9]EGO01731.1 hypothetical protein SERLA73DRAFT_166250 [Serpula lacrymans var. lacrymans S7.3]EGO27370.1 hypothetical protein SERLADRAFT_446593 [Serpula lacrymans var. lacrymans S7.9]